VRSSSKGVFFLVCLAVFGCADDGGALDDGSVRRQDGAAFRDGSASDALRGDAGLLVDVAIRPDVNLPPPIALTSLSMYVNIGDSIAAGFGISSRLSYPDLLTKNDDGAYPTFKGKDFETACSSFRPPSPARRAGKSPIS
jgi:hypothetical protein